MSSSDDACSLTGSEAEKNSGTSSSSPSQSPCAIVLDKWPHSASDEIVVDVLTPPREEDCPNTALANQTELDDRKPNGRLKFFKDGRLCLELLHHDEGKHTKWIQSKAKTFVPPVVRVVKEAKIPCQSISALFPNTTPMKKSNLDKGEDGKALLSVARDPRSGGWRKSSFPKQGISSELIFYMKPAPCTKLFVRNQKSGATRISMHRRRRPYNVHDASDPTDRPFKVEDNNNSKVLSKSECSCYKPDTKIVPSESSTRIGIRKKSILPVLETLSVKRGDNSEDCASKTVELLTKTVQVRRRDESKIQCKAAQSISKKQTRNLGMHDPYVKPILNVPGASKKFKHKASSGWSLPSPQSPINFPIPLPMALSLAYSTSQAINGTATSPQLSPAGGMSGRLQKNLETTKKRLGNKMHATTSPTKLTQAREKTSDHAEGGHSSTSRYLKSTTTSNDDTVHLDRESQDLLKRRTISTAISYTINSLLGNGEHSSEQINETSGPKNLRNSKASPVDNRVHGRKERKDTSKCFVLGAPFHSNLTQEDPNVFLRHLLDTSDPIPSTSAIVSPESASDTLKVSSRKEGIKQEKNPKRKSPKGNATIHERKKLLITEKAHHLNSTLTSPSCQPADSNCLRKSKDGSAFQQRQSFSPSFPVNFPAFDSGPHSSIFTHDAALNLCRRETIPDTNGIMDLSMSSKNRASHRSLDLSWHGRDSSFDSDVPLNLCKNKSSS